MKTQIIERLLQQRSELRDWLLFGGRLVRVVGLRQPRLLWRIFEMRGPWHSEQIKSTAIGLLEMAANRHGDERRQIIDQLAGKYQV